MNWVIVSLLRTQTISNQGIFSFNLNYQKSQWAFQVNYVIEFKFAGNCKENYFKLSKVLRNKK